MECEQQNETVCAKFVTPLNMTGISMENESTGLAQTPSLRTSQSLEQTTQAYEHLRKDSSTGTVSDPNDSDVKLATPI